MPDPKIFPAKVATPAHLRSLPSILKVDEMARLLRVNRKTLYEAVQRDEIPGAFRVGRCLRFRREAVLKWFGQGRLIPNTQGSKQ